MNSKKNGLLVRKKSNKRLILRNKKVIDSWRGSDTSVVSLPITLFFITSLLNPVFGGCFEAIIPQPSFKYSLIF